jgi:hypothetical protein
VELRALAERHGAVLLKAAKKSPNGGNMSRAADPLLEDRRKIELRREALAAALDAVMGLSRSVPVGWLSLRVMM